MSLTAEHVRIVTSNVGDEATIADSPTCVTTLPATNVQNISRVRVARSTSLTDQQFIFNWSGSTVAVSAIHINGHNFTLDGTMTVIGYDDENGTGNEIYNSGAINILPVMTLGDYGADWGVLPLGSSIFYGWGSAYFTLWTDVHFPKSIKITFSDSANPDGYMEWRRILIGKYISPTYNMQWGVNMNWENTHESERTEGNTLRTDEGVIYRTISFTTPHLKQSTERTVWVEFIRTVKGSREIFLSCFPETTGALERDYSMLCKLMENDGFELNQPKLFAANFGFEET